jgi:uncharacterized membrane protein
MSAPPHVPGQTNHEGPTLNHHVSRIYLLALFGAAGTISACSDATAPAPARMITRFDRSASHTPDLLELGSFTTIDFPAATTTLPFSINDQGVIVGRYLSGGRTHGFLRTPDGEFTAINFPGSGFTVAGAVNNDGDIAGWYTLPASASIRHGFLLRDGVFTTFDPPGSIFTNTLGINDRGDIVGRFCTRTPCREPGSGDFHGFLLRDGQFTILDMPASIETNAWSTSARGEILGGFGRAGGGVEMFLLRNDELTTLTPPAGKFFSEDNGGINARGDVVGKYCDASPCVIGPTGQSFVVVAGRFMTIAFPGSRGGGASAINARRDIVGGYFDTGGVLHGYIVRLNTRG